MSKANVSANPLERTSLASLDQSWPWPSAVLTGVIAGAKAAVVATVATAIPTCKDAALARANLNRTAQALIISTSAGAAYFIVADKIVLKTVRKNSFKQEA